MQETFPGRCGIHFGEAREGEGRASETGLEGGGKFALQTPPTAVKTKAGFKGQS